MRLNDIGLKGRVIKIIPVSVYQEKIYTQDIIVELENGQKLALDDSTKLCKEDLLGKVKNLKVSIYVAGSIEMTNKKELKIKPASVDQEDYQGPHAEINGYIDSVISSAETKSEDVPNAVLDIGIGKLGIFLDKESLKIFTQGDHINIKGARLDLREIEPY